MGSPVSSAATKAPRTQQSSKGQPYVSLSGVLIYPHFCRVEEVAKKKGVSMAQIAVAWTLAKDGVSAPIVGTTSLSNLEDIISTWLAFSLRL